MEGYETEKEQVELIKRWLKNNGMSIIVGVALGVALVLGGKWWLSNQKKQAELASEQFEEVLQEIKKGDSEAALANGGHILQLFAKSTYSTLTALELAKLKIDQADLEGARYYLQWVVDHASQAPLKDVARLRLARVLLAKKDYSGALGAVDEVDVKTFSFPVQELKGDILFAKGDRDGARAAYSAASDAIPKGGDRNRIEMKLAEVGGKGAS